MLNGLMILSIKLGNKAFVPGEWFEACHSFESFGTYKGDFEITQEMISDFVANFKAGAFRRWQDEAGNFRLKVNYDHYFGQKAGWITDAKEEPKTMADGSMKKSLWLKADWLPDAVTANRKGYYEYFSIEYVTSYKDDQNQKEFKNVLTGGALTDDPFAMELEPMAMSMFEQKRDEKKKLKDEEEKQTEEQEKLKKEADEMDKIILALKAAGVKLSDNPSEQEVMLAYSKLMEDKKALETKLATSEGTVTTLTDANTKLTKDLDDIKETQKKELAAVNKKRFEELSKKALKDGKLDPAEVKEGSEHLFYKMLTDERFDEAEKLLEMLSKKDVVKGTGGDGSYGNLTDDAAYAQAIKDYAVKNKCTVLQADEILRVEKAKVLAAQKQEGK